MITESSTNEARELLERCVALYNAGVRTRDFSAFLSLLTEDAVLDFEGVPERGPLTGKRAIAQYLQDDPPEDEVHLRRWKIDGDRIFAEFSWLDIPEGGGCLILQRRGSRIAHITIALGGPNCRF